MTTLSDVHPSLKIYNPKVAVCHRWWPNKSKMKSLTDIYVCSLTYTSYLDIYVNFNQALHKWRNLVKLKIIVNLVILKIIMVYNSYLARNPYNISTGISFLLFYRITLNNTQTRHSMPSVTDLQGGRPLQLMRSEASDFSVIHYIILTIGKAGFGRPKWISDNLIQIPKSQHRIPGTLSVYSREDHIFMSSEYIAQPRFFC